MAGRHYALFRGPGGHPAALDDLCPHRRAPLSQGRVRPDGRLACPYHGWSFDAEGQGRSPSCPELRRCETSAHQLVERWGYLWLAERSTPPSSLTQMGWPGFEFAGSLSALFPAAMDVTLDNISEDEHFPFVHTTFGWDEAGAAQVEVATDTFADRSEVRLSARQRPSRWALLGGVRAGDAFHNEWCTRFDPVHAVYTFGWRDPASGAPRPVLTRAVVFLVPETAAATRAHMFLFLDIAASLQRRLRPLTHWLARRIAGTELARDARLTSLVADAPSTLRGMRLTRFDAALIHNRRLLRDLYWGGGELRIARADALEPSAAPSPLAAGRAE